MSLNILLVDDSETVLDVLSRTLHLAGVDVGELYRASNGAEALDTLREKWVDLVFADINMPVMGGVELVGHMAREGLLAATPVIIVSTEGSATRIDALKASGVAAYIRKPFTPESIRTTVHGILGARKAA